MFELLNTHKRVCEGCGRNKLIGCISTGTSYLFICCACLDNASRQIANKADKLYYDRDTGKFINLYKEDIQELEKLYPNIDVIWMIETAMPRWLASKAGLKKAKKSNWLTFVHNWLKHAQARAIGVM